jgi:hypothetical protein
MILGISSLDVGLPLDRLRDGSLLGVSVWTAAGLDQCVSSEIERDSNF